MKESFPWARILLVEWEGLNRHHLRGALRPPAFALFDRDSTLGQWRQADRTIGMQRRLVFEAPWSEVVEVMRHEMAHQYVDEVLRAGAEAPHGAAFRHACARLGCSATEATAPHTRLTQRVRRLLALADSPNRHEAELAMKKAHRLMLEHNVSLIHDGDMQHRRVGPIKMRFEAWERILAGVMTAHFFVSGVWVHEYQRERDRWARQFEILGSAENVAFADYAHHYLSETARRLWKHHHRAQGLGGHRDRARFMCGVITGFREKLAQTTEEAAEAGLVWLAGAALEDEFQRRHPATRASRRITVRSGAAYRAGQEAGRGVVLSRPLGGDPPAPHGRRAALTGEGQQLGSPK